MGTKGDMRLWQRLSEMHQRKGRREVTFVLSIYIFIRFDVRVEQVFRIHKNSLVKLA
jgi:hypothetical protein